MRWLTRRNRSGKLRDKVKRLNQQLIGWVAYFRLARCRTQLDQLDRWIRRKLRVMKLKQLKRKATIQRFLAENGVPSYQAWILALSGKGWWRLGGSPQAHQAMGLKWFEELGLASLRVRWAAYQMDTP